MTSSLHTQDSTELPMRATYASEIGDWGIQVTPAASVQTSIEADTGVPGGLTFPTSTASSTSHTSPSNSKAISVPEPVSSSAGVSPSYSIPQPVSSSASVPSSSHLSAGAGAGIAIGAIAAASAIVALVVLALRRHKRRKRAGLLDDQSAFRKHLPPAKMIAIPESVIST